MYLLTIESDDAESIINILCVAGRLGVKSTVVDAAEGFGLPLQAKPLDVTAASEVKSYRNSAVKSNSEGVWDVLMSLLNERQLNLLQVIGSKPEGCSTKGLADAIGHTDLRALGGVLGSGLKRNILKAGFKDGEVIITEGYGVSRIYTPGPVLLSHGLQLTPRRNSPNNEGDISHRVPATPITPSPEKRQTSPQGMSNVPRLIEAIQIVMCNKGMTAPQIYGLLETRGWLPDSKNPLPYIRTTLHSHREVFKKSGERGVYYLDRDNPYYSSETRSEQQSSKHPTTMNTERSSKLDTPTSVNSERPLSLEDSRTLVDQIMNNRVPLD